MQMLCYYFVRKSYRLRKQYRKLGYSNQASFFVNDEADTGLDRTNDIPMHEPVTDCEAVTENL